MQPYSDEIKPWTVTALTRVVSSSDIEFELIPLEKTIERYMVDTDNVLFQANKLVARGDLLPSGLFGELELSLKQTKVQVDDLEFRLDEMGVTCGSASQAFAYK
jgi:hypothetical protein